MKLFFSYSTHIGDYGGNRFTKFDKTDEVLELYKISMERAKSFGHTIKFYGCEYSLNYLKEYYDEFVNIDDINFDITDDLKIYIHSKEDINCITFDGDIILENKLHIDTSCDVLFEQIEEFETNLQYHEHVTFKMLDVFKKYKIDEKFKNFSFSPQYYFNVGVLKFKNQETKNLLIQSYYELKKYYLQNIEPYEKLIPQGLIVSIIICQYYFTNIIKVKNIKVNFTKNNKQNKYIHYRGHLKFHPNVIQLYKPTTVI